MTSSQPHDPFALAYHTRCVLLAAGASTRLGMSKQLVRLDGPDAPPLVARTCARLIEASGAPERVVVVTGAAHDAVEAALPPGVEVARCADWSRGMGASIAAGAAAAMAHEPAALLLATCDQYALTGEDFAALIRRLGAASDAVDACAAVYDGVVGVPAVFRARSVPALLNLPPERGARALLRGGALSVAAVPLPSAAMDLDTPEALRDARRHLAHDNREDG